MEKHYNALLEANARCKIFAIGFHVHVLILAAAQRAVLQRKVLRMISCTHIRSSNILERV